MAPGDPPNPAAGRTALPLRLPGRKSGPQVYDKAAGPVFEMAQQLAVVRGVDAAVLLKRAGAALARFDSDLTRAGVVPSTIPPARYALGVLLDLKARANGEVDIKQWAAGAHRILFDGRDMSLASLRDFIRKAANAGPDFDGVRGFLERCVTLAEDDRTRFDRKQGTGWGGITAVLVLAFGLLVAGWAGYVEWRFHRDLTVLFNAEALDIGLDRTGVLPDLPQRLDRLAAAVRGVEGSAAKAPLALFARPLGFDAARKAERVYQSALQSHLPAALERAIDTSLASEGEALPLYDTLRAWSVLSGEAAWSPAYLAGWLGDRAALLPDDQGLIPHVAHLLPPTEALAQPDPELLAQARQFAPDAGEGERAYLELIRSDAAAAVPVWVADRAVPGLSQVLQRRSGTPMTAPIAGIYTAAGWTMARDIGAGVAVQTTRAQAARLFDKPPPTQNDAPDLVMDILQSQTLVRWKTYLADLRVRPFSDPASAVLVSGTLSVKNSPLEALLREVWAQAGGTDRGRKHEQQIRVATEFAAMIQYVEQGQMADVAALFAALNVALGAMDVNEEAGLQRLMSVQDRAASVSALRQAPLVVVQIVEDVLAQTSAAHADMLTNPVTKAWQAEVLPLCRQTVEDHFPFATGADASLANVARLLGPGGAMDSFFRNRAAQFIDTSASPWRWKPDARFAGLTPETAEVFEKAQAITAGFFGATGQADTALTLSALAERGKAFVALGGQGGPVETSAEPLQLVWPGGDPAKGVEVSFTTPEGEARLSEPGEWGLFRMLGALRLRERDGGKRFLVDLRSGGARLFMEIGFPSDNNPLARWHLLKGFACPTTL